MPGLPNVAGVLAVDHKFTIGADTNVNSKMYFRYSAGTPSVANLTTMAASIEAAFAANMIGDMASVIVLNEIAVQDLSDMTKPLGIWSGSLAGGQGAFGAPPASACVVIGYKIARRYRGGHPRGYWPIARDQGWTTPGTWASSIVSARKTGVDNYVAAVLNAGAGCTITGQCAVSYYSGVTQYQKPNGHYAYRATQRGTPLVDDVTTRVVNARIGSQRRRLKKA